MKRKKKLEKDKDYFFPPSFIYFLNYRKIFSFLFLYFFKIYFLIQKKNSGFLFILIALFSFFHFFFKIRRFLWVLLPYLSNFSVFLNARKKNLIFALNTFFFPLFFRKIPKDEFFF
jgi:hypothetical protein